MSLKTTAAASVLGILGLAVGFGLGQHNGQPAVSLQPTHGAASSTLSLPQHDLRLLSAPESHEVSTGTPQRWIF